VKIPGKNILVTGGASGLGLAFADHLSHIGANVWGLDCNEESIGRCVERYRDRPGGPRFLRCDVSEESQVSETVQGILELAGGIDVLINNAAILIDQTLVSKLGGKLKRHSSQAWHQTLATNLTGVFLVAREIAESMIRLKRSGLIVNISSISRHGNPGQSAYAASKAGIDALTVTWSQELALFGIRVVGIAPGFVETAMTSKIPPMFLDRIRQQTPLKRFGTLDEFGQTIRYVIENDYLNGKTLEVDGGLRF
jgi:3-oxoacyl-[acyl-carrier protein] reductase